MLKGKRCLITGATGGLGAELALAFGKRGCRLMLTGTKKQALRNLEKKVSPSANVEGDAEADLRVNSEIDRLIQSVAEAMGGLDILINNAAVFPVGPFNTLGRKELDDCLDLNLRSAMILSHSFTPAMVEAGWGRIVNIGSSSAYAGFGGTVAYCASKHGLLGFSRALDDELRSSGVRVIAISPGSIQTPMGRKVQGQAYETFIDPREAAELVCAITGLDGTIAVSELRLGRTVMA